MAAAAGARYNSASMARVIFLWAGILAATAVAAGPAFGASSSAACNTHGLAVSGFRVVGLHAQGLPCTKARTVAGLVTRDLAHGRPVSVSGADGFAMNQQSCTGCKTTTSVSISYPSGKVTVSIRGGSGSSGSLGGGGGLLPSGGGLFPSSGGSGTVVWGAAVAWRVAAAAPLWRRFSRTVTVLPGWAR